MRPDADAFDTETYIARPIAVAELSVNSSYLMRLQRRWAWPTVTLSFVGAGAAAWQVVTQGVSITEIGILIAMYVVTYLGLTVGARRRATWRGLHRFRTAQQPRKAADGHWSGQERQRPRRRAVPPG